MTAAAARTSAAMRLAIEQALTVKGSTYPNPPVGAVILGSDGEVVGVGATEPAGAGRALGRRSHPPALAKPSAPLEMGRHGLLIGPYPNRLQPHGPTATTPGQRLPSLEPPPGHVLGLFIPPGAALISQQ